MPSPRLTLSLVAAALTLGGCASTLTPYSVRPFSDEFEQTSGMGMHNNLVGGLGLHGERLALNARQVRRAGGAPQLVLAVEYVDTDWLFIEGGESLVFLADGDRIALEGTGSRSARVVVSGDQVREISVYSITPAQLRQIAEAQEVRVRLTGSNRHVERELSAENLSRFRAFLDQVAHSGSSGSPM